MYPFYLESIVAEVKPPEIDEIQERIDLEAFQSTVAHVEMLQRHVGRKIASSDRRRPEHIGVEIELERVTRNRIGDRRESPSRAVNDATVCVAEARLRTRRSQPGRAPEVDERQEHAQNDGGGRRRSHCSRK